MFDQRSDRLILVETDYISIYEANDLSDISSIQLISRIFVENVTKISIPRNVSINNLYLSTSHSFNFFSINSTNDSFNITLKDKMDFPGETIIEQTITYND